MVINLFRGMEREDLVVELKKLIRKNIEIPVNRNFYYVLMGYKNLPHSKAYIKSYNPATTEMRIYKHTLDRWLREIEEWIFTKMVEIEPEIRFTELRSM